MWWVLVLLSVFGTGLGAECDGLTMLSCMAKEQLRACRWNRVFWKCEDINANCEGLSMHKCVVAESCKWDGNDAACTSDFVPDYGPRCALLDRRLCNIHPECRWETANATCTFPDIECEKRQDVQVCEHGMNCIWNSESQTCGLRNVHHSWFSKCRQAHAFAAVERDSDSMASQLIVGCEGYRVCHWDSATHWCSPDYSRLCRQQGFQTFAYCETVPGCAWHNESSSCRGRTPSGILCESAKTRARCDDSSFEFNSDCAWNETSKLCESKASNFIVPIRHFCNKMYSMSSYQKCIPGTCHDECELLQPFCVVGQHPDQKPCDVGFDWGLCRLGYKSENHCASLGCIWDPLGVRNMPCLSPREYAERLHEYRVWDMLAAMLSVAITVILAVMLYLSQWQQTEKRNKGE